MTVMTELPIAVAGATGRMGHMLIEAILAADDTRLAGALDIAGSPALGQDASAWLGQTSGVAVSSDLHAGLQNARFLIDFTRPEGTLAHLKVCRTLGVKAVIGTTGFSDAQKAEIADIAKDIAIVMAPNMSCCRWRHKPCLRVMTSRSSKPTTATKSMRPRARRSRWVK
jgi:4-hydroxy-tetrahydrodipicolinate reductase